MTETEINILREAHQRVTAALELLMQDTMNPVTGIREARVAVVDAQNAVNRLFSGERIPFR